MSTSCFDEKKGLDDDGNSDYVDDEENI